MQLSDGRGFNRKYTFNMDYFKKIDTINKAYFLGFILADGCNTRRGLKITIQEDDADVLELFKKDINFTGFIKYGIKKEGNRKNQANFYIGSMQLSRDLEIIGIPPKKTLVAKFPDIPEEFYSHLIRGIFDGDGYVGIDKRSNNLRFSITGTLTLLEKITEILRKECNLGILKYNNQKDRNPIIKSFEYSGNNNCRKIYDYLYKDAEVFMKRKKEKFEMVL